MKVNELIKELEGLNDKLKTKEVFVVAPNGTKFPPHIRFELKNPYNALNFNSENVEEIILSY